MYTDNEEINFQYKNSILINTVNKSIFKKEDFLDRTIIYEMPIIKYYKKEELQIKEFNNLLPQLLGYIFDIVAKAIKIADEMDSDSNVESLPRMADFAFWG